MGKVEDEAATRSMIATVHSHLSGFTRPGAGSDVPDWGTAVKGLNDLAGKMDTHGSTSLADEARRTALLAANALKKR